MNIKYCKNCINFTPMLSNSKLREDEDYSWGYCRLITRLKINEDKLEIVTLNDTEVILEKAVAANQVITIDDNKICPAFSSVADMFNPDQYNINLSNIDILKNLNFVKCKNCYHIFASTENKISEKENYTCPICFHPDNYSNNEHFKLKPLFHDKVLHD